MYGMVNKAVEELVCQNFGEDKWEAIKEKAGVDVDMFISNEGYDDSVTYKLVGAASEVLGLPADAILRAFGEHWILHTAREGYGSLLDANGRNLGEFLNNLPSFHTRVKLIMPNLQPPRFTVTDTTDHSLHLHYYSDRPGLQDFVVGLMQGLGKKFNTPTEVKLLSGRASGADHETFLVEWQVAS